MVMTRNIHHGLMACEELQVLHKIERDSRLDHRALHSRMLF